MTEIPKGAQFEMLMNLLHRVLEQGGVKCVETTADSVLCADIAVAVLSGGWSLSAEALEEMVDRWHDTGGKPDGEPVELRNYLGMPEHVYEQWMRGDEPEPHGGLVQPPNPKQCTNPVYNGSLGASERCALPEGHEGECRP